MKIDAFIFLTAYPAGDWASCHRARGGLHCEYMAMKEANQRDRQQPAMSLDCERKPTQAQGDKNLSAVR